MKKNLKSKISWHCPFKLPFACTKLYKVKTANSRCHSLPIGNYIPWLWIYLKVPPPPPNTQTHKLCKYILRAGGRGDFTCNTEMFSFGPNPTRAKKSLALFYLFILWVRGSIFFRRIVPREKFTWFRLLKAMIQWSGIGKLRGICASVFFWLKVHPEPKKQFTEKCNTSLFLSYVCRLNCHVCELINWIVLSEYTSTHVYVAFLTIRLTKKGYQARWTKVVSFDRSL